MSPAQRPWLIVPVRSLLGGKSRLSGVMDPLARHRFNEWLLHRVLGVAASWPGTGQCVVVSACDDALALAKAHGALRLRQAKEGPTAGLNAGLSLAARLVREHDPKAGLLVVACDLPRLQAADLRHFVGNGQRCRVATDVATRGSNALFVPAGQAPHFAFGPDSRHLHEQHCGAEVVYLDGLAFDVDTPQDLIALEACPA